jgi:hypothetical protein
VVSATGELDAAMRALGIDPWARSRVEFIRPEPDQVWTNGGDYGDFDVALDEARSLVGMPDGTALSVEGEGRSWFGVLWGGDAHDAPPLAGADEGMRALTMVDDEARLEDFAGWRDLWEGPEADAALMLSASLGADRQALVAAVCDCVRTCFGRLPEGEPKRAVVEAVEAAQALVHGKGSDGALSRAGWRAHDLGQAYQLDSPTREACHAALSTTAVASTGSARSAVLAVKGAAECIDLALGGGGRLARGQRLAMAALVRRMIPVGVPMMLRVRRLLGQRATPTRARR